MSDSSPFSIGDQLLIMETHEQRIRRRLGEMATQGVVQRFWEKDGRLWQRAEDDPAISRTMGWLTVAETMRERMGELTGFADGLRRAGFTRAVLAGMGGSSLAPLVLTDILGKEGIGFPVSILDSTDPETVLRIERGGALDSTLFIIASKSGSTAEPNAFNDYFYSRIGEMKSNPGDNFVAITDPGTEMEQKARRLRFRKVFLNFADIGGRFSALSYFGMVPAALLGIDVELFLNRAIEVVEENKRTDDGLGSAFVLGAALGELSLLGQNKLTFVMPQEYESLGLWLEQLLAESTGKEGKGILPVAGEQPGTPSEYGNDRVFAYIRPRNEDCTFLDMRIATLRDAGHPIVQIALNDHYDVAREFMRWEIATAVAGSVLGINPFDQPNVQEAKDITKQFIAQVEQQGSLPAETPTAEADGIQFFGNVHGSDLSEMIFSFLADVKAGDFVALMAYLTETPEMTDALTKLQRHIRDATLVATTKGYGPRFLHSTGQFHKGGPNVGHFIQFTKIDGEDAKLPGKQYTFGTFRNAQALGDRETLKKHGRKVIRIELGEDPVSAVQKLIRAVDRRQTVAQG